MISDTFYKKGIVISFLLALFFLFPPFILAQTGTLKGVVFDKGTNEALAGANIIIKGTSLGAASDFEGNYIIHNVPAGKQTVVISYIGYQQSTQEITVKEGSTLTQNFYIASEAVTTRTVEITAQAQGQLQAINQQLSSNTITNVVSAEKIHQLPDANAATALSRLPGLSLQDGDKVVVRGIQSKMNVVLVNGVQLPSTDMNDRSTNLGFISSNMLSGIEVVKAITPDMDANAIGGVVNLRLREAPSDFHLDVLSQGSYNTHDRVADNYKFWASTSYRFLDNKLGVFVQGNMDRSDQGNDQAEANYNQNGNDIGYGQTPYFMHDFNFIDEANLITNKGGSVILDYVLPHGKIMLQNTIAHTINDMARYRMELNFETNALTYALNRDKHNKELLVNALQAEYTFGDLKTELGLSHSFSDKNTDLRYGDPGNAFGFQNGIERHPFGLNAAGKAITFNNSQLAYFTPEDVYDLELDPTDWKNAIITGWAITRGEAFKQHLYNATLDLSYPVAFTDDFLANFKAGGKFSRTTRINDVEESYRRTGEEDFYYGVKDFLPYRTLSKTNPITMNDIRNMDYKRGEYFLDDTYNFQYVLDKDMMDRFMPSAKAGWLKSRHKTRSERDDFNGAEIFSAGYFMGNFSIGPRLSIIAGLRYEHYNMDYHARFVYVTHSVDGNGNIYDTLNSVNRNDDKLFPNAQVRYKFTDWLDLRFAYTNSISRPDYRAILPNTYYSPGESGQAGNTKLKPTISYNYDLSVAVYNNEIGLFTVGGFYKKLTDVFFQTNIYYKNLKSYNISFPDSAVWKNLNVNAPVPSEQVTTFVNNPHPAYIRGVELEWQTNFWYLPQPFNSLVLNINYTRIWSDMDYQQVRNQAIPYQDGRFTKYRYITTDTVRNARLLFQGDHVLNIALGVDYKDFSGRISFNLQGDVITTVGSRPEEDAFTGNVYKWDFALQQKLPLQGLSVSLNGINIFHNATKSYEKFRRSLGGPILDDNLVRTIYTPRVFEFNIRYSL